MLDGVRLVAQGWLGKVVLGVIAVAFALLGHDQKAVWQKNYAAIQESKCSRVSRV